MVDTFSYFTIQIRPTVGLLLNKAAFTSRGSYSFRVIDNKNTAIVVRTVKRYLSFIIKPTDM